MSALAQNLARPLAAASPLDDFAVDLVQGLSASPKHLPAKYFYDAAGSALFEQITALPEYYPTRTEIAILDANAPAIARSVPRGGALIEFGSGSSAKLRRLLPRLPGMAAYVPVDVSRDFLKAEAARLQRDFAGLRVRPVVADFTADFPLPPEARGVAKAGFFPGSTIGNFEPPAAGDLLRHFGRVLGAGATLIIGVDLVKDEAVLHAAYNDSAGVTAAFNRNILARANRELGTSFDLDAFEHRAFFNAERGRIEMHLVSRKRQTLELCGMRVAFEAGETIHTENSYKYTVEGFSDLARTAGWATEEVWTDDDRYFAVLGLSRTPTDED